MAWHRTAAFCANAADFVYGERRTTAQGGTDSRTSVPKLVVIVRQSQDTFTEFLHAQDRAVFWMGSLL